MNKIKPFTVFDQPQRDISSWFVPVDKWDPVEDQDKIFVPCKGSVWLPVAEFFGINDPAKQHLNVFVISTKRCYNGEIMRTHISRYLNYFEKYYDKDHELLAMISGIKCYIDLDQS